MADGSRVADRDGDGVLLVRAQGGDLDAFGALVRLHQARVRQQLARLTHGDLHRADDLAQQTFVQAWRALRDFRGDARITTWLHRIAWTCFLQDERARKPMLSLDEALAATSADDGPTDDAGSDPQAVPMSVDPRRAQALQIDLARALEALPGAERAAIIHCFQLDLTHDEAAAVLGLPLGTLKTQVARAKARLRERLAAWRAEETS